MAFVIKEHRPGKWRIILSVSMALWLTSAWLAYEAGWLKANHNFDVMMSKQKMLKEELDELRQTKSQLLTEVSRLQRTAQVDRQAKIELAKEVKDFQDQQAQLREEISFYKSIFSPEDGESGLTIYSLEIQPVKDRLFHYKLVLTRSGKNDSLVQGGVDITVKGVLGGVEKSLNMENIKVTGSQELSYKFRYFQELSGSFQLPKDYNPRNVTVKLITRSGRKSNKPARVFDWQKVRF